MLCLGTIHHRLNTIGGTDIAGIDPYLIRAVFHGGYRQTIIKMDIRHQRNMDLRNDLPYGLGCILIRHGTTDDITPHLFETQNLRHSACHIIGFGIGHGLDQNGMMIPDDPVFDMNLSCIFSFHCSILTTVFEYPKSSRQPSASSKAQILQN